MKGLFSLLALGFLMMATNANSQSPVAGAKAPAPAPAPVAYKVGMKKPYFGVLKHGHYKAYKGFAFKYSQAIVKLAVIEAETCFSLLTAANYPSFSITYINSTGQFICAGGKSLHQGALRRHKHSHLYVSHHHKHHHKNSRHGQPQPQPANIHNFKYMNDNRCLIAKDWWYISTIASQSAQNCVETCKKTKDCNACSYAVKEKTCVLARAIDQSFYSKATNAASTTCNCQTYVINWAKCNNANPQQRLEAGWPGITRSQCTDRGACFDDRTPNVKWCFQPSDRIAAL